jgi:Ca2+:H+ antiporter
MTASACPRASAAMRLFFQTPLDWLVLAVPAAFAIRFVPAWSNESLLFIAAGVGIILLAGWLGRATEQLSARTGAGIGGFLNATFVNAAEHTTAVWAALKNKMDLSLSIALDSSLQVALFVTPMLVFASYAFGSPMDLEFSLPEIVAIAVAI